jgi:hypothetical protein
MTAEDLFPVASAPRCPTCGIVLEDPLLIELGYCTSECERDGNVSG